MILCSLFRLLLKSATFLSNQHKDKYKENMKLGTKKCFLLFFSEIQCSEHKLLIAKNLWMAFSLPAPVETSKQGQEDKG